MSSQSPIKSRDFIRKVKHGTPIHGETPLCTTCRNAQIVKGLAESERHTYCHALSSDFSGPQEVTYHVSECNRYDDKTQPALYEMQSMAWKVATDRDGRKIGFLSPKEYERRVKEGKIEEHNDD